MYGGSWNDGFFERIQFDEMEEIMEIKCDDLEKSKKQFTVAGVKKINFKIQDTYTSSQYDFLLSEIHTLHEPLPSSRN